MAVWYELAAGSISDAVSIPPYFNLSCASRLTNSQKHVDLGLQWLDVAMQLMPFDVGLAAKERSRYEGHYRYVFSPFAILGH